MSLRNVTINLKVQKVNLHRPGGYQKTLFNLEKHLIVVKPMFIYIL